MSRISVEDKFWSKVDKRDPEECWNWLGSKTKTGYGLFWPERRTTRTAHSFAFELATEIRAATYVFDIHHKCYNKSCVNPAHLELFSRQENTSDAFDILTHCKRNHEWTEENAKWRFDGKYPRRQCRECIKIRSLARTL